MVTIRKINIVHSSNVIFHTNKIKIGCKYLFFHEEKNINCTIIQSYMVKLIGTWDFTSPTSISVCPCFYIPHFSGFPCNFQAVLIPPNVVWLSICPGENPIHLCSIHPKIWVISIWSILTKTIVMIQ